MLCRRRAPQCPLALPCAAEDRTFPEDKGLSLFSPPQVPGGPVGTPEPGRPRRFSLRSGWWFWVFPAPAGGGRPRSTCRGHRAPHARRGPPGGCRLSPLTSHTGCGASAGGSALSSTGVPGARRATRGVSAAGNAECFRIWSSTGFPDLPAETPSSGQKGL